MLPVTENAPKTLQETQDQIKLLTRQNIDHSETVKRQLEMLKAEARSLAHLEFYEKYSEWDWAVRQQYMNLIKPLAYEWPISNDSRGYAFELQNYTPWFEQQINDPNFIVTPDCIRPYDIRGARFSSLTEFVRAENIDKCKLTQKIADAFKLLKYLTPDHMQGRGFGISAEETTWSDQQDFDYEGYKFHL